MQYPTPKIILWCMEGILDYYIFIQFLLKRFEICGGLRVIGCFWMGLYMFGRNILKSGDNGRCWAGGSRKGAFGSSCPHVVFLQYIITIQNQPGNSPPKRLSSIISKLIAILSQHRAEIKLYLF